MRCSTSPRSRPSRATRGSARNTLEDIVARYPELRGGRQGAHAARRAAALGRRAVKRAVVLALRRPRFGHRARHGAAPRAGAATRCRWTTASATAPSSRRPRAWRGRWAPWSTASCALDLARFGGSALTDRTIAVPTRLRAPAFPSPTCRRATPSCSSLALAWAEVLGADAIFIGANAVDYSGYPDCRPEYLRGVRDAGEPRHQARGGRLAHRASRRPSCACRRPRSCARARAGRGLRADGLVLPGRCARAAPAACATRAACAARDSRPRGMPDPTRYRASRVMHPPGRCASRARMALSSGEASVWATPRIGRASSRGAASRSRSSSARWPTRPTSAPWARCPTWSTWATGAACACGCSRSPSRSSARHALQLAGLVDLSKSIYTAPELHLAVLRRRRLPVRRRHDARLGLRQQDADPHRRRQPEVAGGLRVPRHRRLHDAEGPVRRCGACAGSIR